MEFVALLRFRPSVPASDRDAALMRRAAWQYPEGVKLIAEYWPMSGEYQVVTVFAAETIAPIMAIEFEWNDAFGISVYPGPPPRKGYGWAPRSSAVCPGCSSPADRGATASPVGQPVVSRSTAATTSTRPVPLS